MGEFWGRVPYFSSSNNASPSLSPIAPLVHTHLAHNDPEAWKPSPLQGRCESPIGTGVLPSPQNYRRWGIPDKTQVTYKAPVTAPNIRPARGGCQCLPPGSRKLDE